MNAFSILAFKLIKFCMVGFTGMVIDFSVTWLLKEKVAVNKYIANSMGFILAAVNNFIWNRIWTFESGPSSITLQFTLFISISLAGLALNNLLIYLLHEKLKWNFYLSKIVAIGLVTIWNFLMNLFFTFN